MLYVSLILSALLFSVVNLAAIAKTRPVVKASLIGLGLSLATICMGAVFPPLVVQAALMCGVAIVWRYSQWSPARFLFVSSWATVFAYAPFLYYAAERQSTFNRMAEQYPFESMEARAPRAIPDRQGVFNPSELENFERDLERHGGWFFSNRSNQLQTLHERTVANFTNAPGFGVIRMVRPEPSVETLSNPERNGPTPMQPSHPSYGLSDTAKPLKPSLDELSKLHGSGLLDFLNPQGFGYVKDRQHVAGFQSHRFSKVPEAKDVEVARLELVSLLMHKEPGVYLSERLPQMDALKGVPMRPLDAFETEGLAALRKGEDVFVREDRMLGSIRSVKQCIACHGGERGQLLGAFTYTLRPAGK